MVLKFFILSLLSFTAPLSETELSNGCANGQIAGSQRTFSGSAGRRHQSAGKKLRGGSENVRLRRSDGMNHASARKRI